MRLFSNNICRDSAYLSPGTLIRGQSSLICTLWQLIDHCFIFRKDPYLYLFSLALKHDLIQYLKRRGFKELITSLNPLNTTNLILQRRSECLLAILLVLNFKRHSIIQKISVFLKNLIRPPLGLINNFSNFESICSTVERLLLNLSLVGPSVVKFESLHKDLKMHNSDQQGSLIPQNSNLLKFISINSNHNQGKLTSNAQKAKDFILQHRLTKETIKHSAAFKDLDPRLKQSIYFQLRKQEPLSQNPGLANLPSITGHRAIAKKSKTPPSLKSASLLMIPTILAECLLLTFSYLFYLELGFSFGLACCAALCVELFFMLASGSKKMLLQTLRWIIFGYSAFTVSYSTYINDPNIKSAAKQSEQQMAHLEYQLEQQKQVANNLMQKQQALMADLAVYRQHNLVTRGRGVLSKEQDFIANGIKENQLAITALISQIGDLKQAQIGHSVFAFANLKVVEMRTWVVIMFLALIQLLSSICTNEFANSYRNYQSKRKHKKFYFKGDKDGASATYIKHLLPIFS